MRPSDVAQHRAPLAWIYNLSAQLVNLSHVDALTYDGSLTAVAIIRNLRPRMLAFDCAALGTQDHHGGTSPLDPASGQRTHKPHVRALPKSLTLAACANPRLPLANAIADGSARDGLPDAVLDDPDVKRLVRAGDIAAMAEPKSTPGEVNQ